MFILHFVKRVSAQVVLNEKKIRFYYIILLYYYYDRAVLLHQRYTHTTLFRLPYITLERRRVYWVRTLYEPNQFTSRRH